MIVTLAGHVDHGKTTLVKMLTGVNTDRLHEEQARGLTIDLGFAYIDDGKLGFVDVPGHHKFIHNMVAGVAGDQTALLVIAADDGPMPQSKEHLEILALAGIRSGVVAMTKADRVDAARLATCRQEIANLVAGTFLEAAPVITTSIDDAESAAALLQALRDRTTATPRSDEAFRYAIDRVFTLKGAGLVVTGTIHAGRISEGDTVWHFPSQAQLRIRSIRAQDRAAPSAGRGDRCALNITGIELELVSRGDWLTASPRTAAREISVELSVLKDFPRAIRHWLPVHIYHATSHATGHIALHDHGRVQPGTTALVDLVCEAGLAVQHGDQLILRDHGLDTTLGGARVVHAAPNISRRRRNTARLATLQAYQQASSAADCARTLLSQGAFSLDAFKSVWQIADEEMATLLAEQQAIQVDQHAISRAHLAKLAKAALEKISAHMQNDPSSPGLKENAFMPLLGSFTKQVLGALVQTRRVALHAGYYAPPAHQAALPDGLQNLWHKLEPRLDQLQPPSSGDLAKEWKTDHKALERDLKELTKRGRLVNISEHRYYLPRQLDVIVGEVKMLAAAKPFSVREFRDHTQIGRNIAIDLLEYLDSKGFTKRQDNVRVVLRDTL